MPLDSYRTLAKRAEAELIEKRSRFLAMASPVPHEEEALSLLQDARSKYWDASHNVYAYALREGQLRRFSDDGEPQGTAGMPVLDVLQKERVTDCIVIVTRYFGGVLLGVGGLVRAYTKAAKLALDAAGVVTMRRAAQCALVCDYALHGRVGAVLAACGAVIEDTAFSDRVAIRFLLDLRETGRCEAALRDATGGTIAFDVIGEQFAPLGD